MVYAKNGIRADINIDAREQYDADVEDYSNLLNDDDFLINIWNSASQKYGRVDLSNYPVYPNESKMTHYGEALVFDFVAEMLSEMSDFANTSILMQTLDPNQGSLFPLEFKTGYANINTSHAGYLQRKIDEFLRATKDNERNKRILNFKDFQKSFLGFIKRTERGMLLSKSKYYTSKVGNPSMSGLFIETKLLPHGDDANKISIITDNNFPYFVELARRHGFFVDKNAPWRIIVDIRSCYVRNKLKQRGITNLVEFFEEYYIPSYSTDFIDIKDIFYGLWNSYCGIRPFVDNLTDTQCGFGITVTEREKIKNMSDISKRQWSRLYIDIRVQETLRNYSPNYILDLLQEAELYFEEDDWEEKVAKHIENQLIKKTVTNSLTKASNIYRIIDKDCPDLQQEEEEPQVGCEVDENAVAPPSRYEPSEEVEFPSHVERALDNSNRVYYEPEDQEQSTQSQSNQRNPLAAPDLPPGTERQ